MQKPKAQMDKKDRAWLNSHTVFWLSLTVDEIEAMRVRIEKLEAENDKLWAFWMEAHEEPTL